MRTSWANRCASGQRRTADGLTPAYDRGAMVHPTLVSAAMLLSRSLLLGGVVVMVIAYLRRR